MNNAVQKQTLTDQIAALLQYRTWTAENAISILATIQLHKQSNDHLEVIGLLENIQEQCAKFVHDGIETGQLHLLDENSENSSFANFTSGVAGGFGLKTLLSGSSGALSLGSGLKLGLTGLGTGVATPLLITGGLAVAALKFLPDGRKNKFLKKKLIPAEVAIYARNHGKWLDNVEPRIEFKSAKTVVNNDSDSLDEKTLTKKIRQNTGAQKGKKADKVKVQITAMAILELEAGCKCHNPELARFLMKQKKSTGESMFTLPGILESRYEDHFIEATNSAFKAKGIPLRNESKNGKQRGKKNCKRPGHSS